jgi:antitoxin MazE
MRISKWGNSLAVRLPVELIEALNLREGDEVELSGLEPGQLSVQRRLNKAEAWAKLSQITVDLPPGYKFDRDEANAR